MSSLAQSGKYGAINTTDTMSMGYYGIKFVSEAYSLQDDTTCGGKNSSSDELVVKLLCIICMQ